MAQRLTVAWRAQGAARVGERSTARLLQEFRPLLKITAGIV
jgi:hypothetical protein